MAWPHDDQDKAVAYVLHRRRVAQTEAEAASGRCSECGTVPEDWIDPTTGQRLAEPAWIVETHICPGCRYIEAKENELAVDEATKKHRRTRLRRATEADYDPASELDD